MSEERKGRKPAGGGKPRPPRTPRTTGADGARQPAKRQGKAKAPPQEVAAAAPPVATSAAAPDVPAIPEPPARPATIIPRQSGRRYSRFVGLMKVALPVAALALIAAVVAWPGGDASRPGALPISFANIKIDPTGLTMKSPRFVGVDNQGQAYTVTADEAVQDKADAERVDLTNPEAEITLTDRGWFHLQSQTGVIHPKTSIIDLHGDVSLYSSEGWEAHGTAVTANMEEGTARSDQPVTGQGPAGTLSADRFEAWNGGHNLRFLGNVRMTVMPSTRS